jgi:hypothetical protein
MASAVSVDFVNGMKRFKKRISTAAIYEAWKSGDYTKAFTLVPWGSLHGDLESSMGSIAEGLVKASKNSIKTLPKPAVPELRYDTKNPYIERYLQNRTAFLVGDISNDTQKVISRAVTMSFDRALTPKRVAELIKPSIGLNPRQVTALDNYREGLRQGGLSERKLEELSSSYEDRLLQQRAIMIGRTETNAANNHGQLSVWKAAQNQGLVDNSKKVWIVDGNPCPTCIALGESEPIPLDEQFETEDGDLLDAPPAHPNCMCTMEIQFGEPEEEGEGS